MLAMPGTRERGRMARLAILRELDRRERAGIRPPTYDELAAMLAIEAPSVVPHIAKLRAAGLVTSTPGRYRSLALTGDGHKAVQGI